MLLLLPPQIKKAYKSSNCSSSIILSQTTSLLHGNPFFQPSSSSSSSSSSSFSFSSLLSPLTMPSKYSHGLVLSQQQHYPGIINPDAPSSLKPSSSHSSATSSLSSLSDYSAQSAVISDYVRLEPDAEQKPSRRWDTSTQTQRPSFHSSSSDAARLKSTSSELPRPPSVRLRLESPFGLRIEDPPSPLPRLEPTLSERPHSPSHRPSPLSSPQNRLRLGDPPPPPPPLHPRTSRPSLHHKSSSLETQIYAPEETTSHSPTREGQNLYSVEAPEPYHSPSPTHVRQYYSPVPPLQEDQVYPSRPSPVKSQHHTSPTFAQERQDVSSMEFPDSFPPPISTGNRQARSPSETQPACLPSPIRGRRQAFREETQALASPQRIKFGLGSSPFGTENIPMFPSARDLEDYFSTETQGSHSTSAATEDRQDFIPTKARSALPPASQNDQARPSLDMERLQSPIQTQEHRGRPSLETRQFSFESRRTILESVHGRRPSIDSPNTRGHQNPRSPGLPRSSLDKFIKETQHSRRQSIDSNTTQERQSRPLKSQELSLEQFMQESEHMWEPSISSQTYSPQPSFHTGKSNSRHITSASAQRYIPKNTSLEHSPRSRRDRPSKLPDTFASHHRILLPTSEGAYDNVFIETHGFPPKRPPSPPATPDSSKNFSAKLQAEEFQRIKPTPPVPQRNARRSPSRQQSMLRSNTSSAINLRSEPPRPKTSSTIDAPTNSKKATALHSPTLSISPRKSSINATTSRPSMSFSNFSEAMMSPPRVSFNQPRDWEGFEDESLDSLPEIDYNVLPFEDPNAGPAIFRANQLGLEDPISPRYEYPDTGPALIRATQLGIPDSHDRPLSSRASSFDSAAPPPIGLTRRISHATADSRQPRMPKKESKMSLLSFLRSTTAPKAVLYSQTAKGKSPVSVSISRTAGPSIPSLFPGHRGQTLLQKTRDGHQPRMRPGLDPRISAPRSRAHIDAADKRRSWLTGEDVDTNRRASLLEKKKEFERILNNI